MDTLLDRGTIEGYQHQAAERFLRDWQLSQVGALRTVSLEMRVDGARGGGVSDTQAAAMGRLGEALRSLGRVDTAIVRALTVDRMTLEQIGARMRAAGLKWPPKRYGADRVGEALDQLAAHYGLATRAQA